MATDALLSFNAAGFTSGSPSTGSAGAADTVTATGATNPVTIPGVQRSHALYVRIRYSAAGNASGTNTVLFKVQAYDPNPIVPLAAGFFDHTVDGNKQLTLGGSTPSPSAGEIFLPISTASTQVKLAFVVAGSGSTPTIKVIADLVNSNV